MRIMISYFYQIRNFEKNMIPVSTACGDPSWYHPKIGDKESQGFDKRGIWLGIRCPDLSPYLLSCNCPCEWHKKRNKECGFLLDYKNYLNTLNFNSLLIHLKRLEEWSMKALKIKNPIIVLMVHEAPTNPCSERESLIQWFKENGYQLEQFKK